MQLSTTLKTKIAQFSRTVLDADYTGGFAQLIQDLFDAIDAGSVGITASAADVDSLAKDGGHFQYDPDNTAGLTFAYKAGRLHNNVTQVAVAAGTVLLTNSTTNYVEVDSAGNVTANTSGFTATSMPLYQVTTGVSSIVTVVNKKYLLTLPTLLTGARQSTSSKTRVLLVPIGTLSATGSAKAISLPFACKVTGVELVVDTTVAASDTDYWTFTLVNKGPSGSGTTAVLAATDPNTTKATGGSGLVNYVARDLTLHGTSANLDLASKDVLVLTATKSGSAANLVNLLLAIYVTFEN